LFGCLGGRPSAAGVSWSAAQPGGAVVLHGAAEPRADGAARGGGGDRPRPAPRPRATPPHLPRHHPRLPRLRAGTRQPPQTQRRALRRQTHGFTHRSAKLTEKHSHLKKHHLKIE